jgi:hypothetical protein
MMVVRPIFKFQANHPRELRPDSAVRGPPARGDSEAKSNQKSRHASEAEAVWAASDSRGKARTAPVSLGPKALPASYGWNLPGGSSVACLFTSFFP